MTSFSLEKKHVSVFPPYQYDEHWEKEDQWEKGTTRISASVQAAWPKVSQGRGVSVKGGGGLSQRLLFNQIPDKDGA